MPHDASVQQIQTLTRRTFLGGGAAALAAYAAAPAPAAALDLGAGSGYWLGERYWGNRLQDWLGGGGG
ncbi:hypothetical protein, partial [Nostocoides australiense]|uniref:hypothetical protein n=1 Tax=Nostocoides australiense TaxID=99480 RepID=UPI00065FDCE9